MARTGRPPKEINQIEFEKLCKMQCTCEEICDWFDVTDKTLNTWCRKTYGETFSVVFAKKRSRGKVSLRRLQWQHAERSVPMAIWLGKQYLGQKEKSEDSVDTEDTDAYLHEAGIE